MSKLYNLKHKFLMLVSALVFSGLIPTILSAHSTGAWIATSQCGTKAFIFVSAWHGAGAITPTQGLYIDRNKDGNIINALGVNKSVCTLSGATGGELTGTTGVANSSDYFPMSTWITSTAAGLPNTNLTSHTDPVLLDGLKKWLKDVKGIDTTGFTISPIWTPGGGIGTGNAESFMVLDLDVTQLETGTTFAHMATTTVDFTPCCPGACSGNGAFPITLTLPETPPSTYVAVQNPRVSLNGNCKKTITPLNVIMGFKEIYQLCFNFDVKINDSDPSNGGVVDGVSPPGGWTFGVFKDGQLIAQGQLTVDDSSGPVFSPNQKTAWETIDTIVTWSDNVDEILNVPSSWFGNVSGYHLPPTFDGANKYYTGRPYMTDSCELSSYPVNTGTFAQNTWIIDKDSSGTSSNRDSFLVHRSWNLQYKVTDYLENPQCDSSGFQHKLRRTFEIIDQRGNRTFLNQIIYFKRPDLRKTNTNRFAREFALVAEPMDRGPGNLGQFGPFGNGPRKAHAHYGEADNLPAGGLINFREKLGADQMSTANYSLYIDTISYNTSLGTCGSFDAQTELKPLLTSIYIAVDTLPGGKKDSISLFSSKWASTYDITYNHKEFALCNNSKSYEVVTEIFDWCTGTREKDTLIIRIMDQTPPVFEAYNANALGGTIRGRALNDSIIIPIGVSDCTASLRLPSKSGSRTNLRDLSSLFNWGVYDKCSGGNTTTDRNGTGVTLNYKFESRDVWNDRYFTDRENYTPVNYTMAEMNGGLVALGLPIGEHRLIIEAWDGCDNEKKDTLYFDVQDKTAPVMICKDQINVSLTSNSTGNYFLRNSESNRDMLKDQHVRVWVKDIDKGSRDNCTLDSMYVRRKIDWNTCGEYLKWNMEYDLHGNNNGVVDELDFEAIPGSNLRYTPMYMQYIELFCCGDESSSQVIYELWGSDLVQGILGNSDNNAPAGRSWSFCWGTVQLYDNNPPTITAPLLSKHYNATAKNWINCTDKELIGDPTVNLPLTLVTDLADDTYTTANGKIATRGFANTTFGTPDIFGIECNGTVKYGVIKKLTCDTGIILRHWEVTKIIKSNPLTQIVVRDTQVIYVQANHDYAISVPQDRLATCLEPSFASETPEFDEDGCDLLAISDRRETVYDATSPLDNACKKIYRTWTVINWCQVPNQLGCNNVDPISYARVIPRLKAVNVPADVNGDAVAITHRFKKGVSSAVRDKPGISVTHEISWVNGNYTGANWPTNARTGNTAITQTPGKDYNQTGAQASLSDYAVSTSTTCTASGENTFAWQYTQVIKIQDNTKPSIVGAADGGPARRFTEIDLTSDAVNFVKNWNPSSYSSSFVKSARFTTPKEVFGIRGKMITGDNGTTGNTPTTGPANACHALVKFSFDVKDGCSVSGPFSLDDAKVVFKKSALLNTPIPAVSDKTFTWTTALASNSNITISPADPGTNNSTFTVSIDNLPIDQTGGDGNVGYEDYQLLVTVRDDCGNVLVDRIDFTVADVKAPAPVCVQNFVATLMPADISANKGMVVIRAVDVFQDIYRNWGLEECTGPVKATIVRLDKDYKETGVRGETVQMTCDDITGSTQVRVYLSDGAGNEDFCTVNIALQDNIGLCNATAPNSVAGAIQTESKATVEGVQVNLSGESQKLISTGVNGIYMFNNLTKGLDYTVTPSLNKGFLNGVSTYDLILISKHILGNHPLNTPYKLIAADVNNSKTITTLDMIQLRKLILNIDAAFPNNNSWRFVDASYTFPIASNPWAASFPEVKNVNDLKGSLSANFVAVKVGDVSGNAIANSTQVSVRHLTSTLDINVADMNLVAGNEYKVDFTTADFKGIEGFQFTLNLDKKGLELVDLVPGIAAEENFGIFAEEGVVTASWHGEAKGSVLFSLVVRATSNTTLSEVLNLNSRYTAAEAYKGGEVVNVGLNFNASKASANYELYQNTPNPFAGETIIGFNLPAAGAATLTIQDVTGRTLKVINGQYVKGYNQVSLKSWELMAVGVLTYTLKVADFTMTRKMIVVE